MTEVVHLIFEVRKSSVTFSDLLVLSCASKVKTMARQKKTLHPFDQHLGGAIKATRARRKLTQQQLADAAGIPLSNLQRREDGSNETSVAELERIAAVLRVTSREIVEMALQDYNDGGDPEAGLRKLVASVSEPPRTVAPEDEIPYIGPVAVSERHAAYTDPEADTPAND